MVSMKDSNRSLENLLSALDDSFSPQNGPAKTELKKSGFPKAKIKIMRFASITNSHYELFRSVGHTLNVVSVKLSVHVFVFPTMREKP